MRLLTRKQRAHPYFCALQTITQEVHWKDRGGLAHRPIGPWQVSKTDGKGSFSSYRALARNGKLFLLKAMDQC